jgi:hypothetical protein
MTRASRKTVRIYSKNVSRVFSVPRFSPNNRFSTLARTFLACATSPPAVAQG